MGAAMVMTNWRLKPILFNKLEKPYLLLEMQNRD